MSLFPVTLPVLFLPWGDFVTTTPTWLLGTPSNWEKSHCYECTFIYEGSLKHHSNVSLVTILHVRAGIGPPSYRVDTHSHAVTTVETRLLVHHQEQVLQVTQVFSDNTRKTEFWKETQSWIQEGIWSCFLPTVAWHTSDPFPNDHKQQKRLPSLWNQETAKWNFQ